MFRLYKFSGSDILEHKLIPTFRSRIEINVWIQFNLHKKKFQSKSKQIHKHTVCNFVMFWSSCFCYEIVVVFIDEIEWCIDVLKCSKSCCTCGCRMEIITKLFHLCIVRTTVIQWLIVMFIVLPGRKFSTDSNHTTTTEAIMTYVPHAVRISCWKSNSWLTSSRRMRSDKTFACLLFFFIRCVADRKRGKCHVHGWSVGLSVNCDKIVHPMAKITVDYYSFCSCNLLWNFVDEFWLAMLWNCVLHMNCMYKQDNRWQTTSILW